MSQTVDGGRTEAVWEVQNALSLDLAIQVHERPSVVRAWEPLCRWRHSGRSETASAAPRAVRPAGKAGLGLAKQTCRMLPDEIGLHHRGSRLRRGASGSQSDLRWRLVVGRCRDRRRSKLRGGRRRKLGAALRAIAYADGTSQGAAGSRQRSETEEFSWRASSALRCAGINSAAVVALRQPKAISNGSHCCTKLRLPGTSESRPTRANVLDQQDQINKINLPYRDAPVDASIRSAVGFGEVSQGRACATGLTKQLWLTDRS